MIRVMSTTRIRPDEVSGDKEVDESSCTRVELGPSDLQILLMDQIQKGILFHKPPTTTTLSLVNLLKDSFSKAINIFYPLAGRLISVDNNDDEDTVSFFIDCNNAGAEFVHATADGSVTAADILDPVIVPDALVYSFFSMNNVLNHDAAVSGLPLLSAKVTELADAVFVACSMNHCVADGSFFWHFFRTWSDIARAGVEVDALPIVFGRGFLDGIVDLPLRIPKSSLVSVKAFERPGPGQLQQRMFRFSKATVAELKARANAEVGGNRGEISSLQALLAHLWISITRSRGHGQGSSEVVTYLLAVGLRQRMGLSENLPEAYLGNAVQYVVAESTAGEVVTGGLGAAALLFKRAIASHTVSEVRSRLKAWAESPEMLRLGTPAANKLGTGSSPWFDVYGCDFGWGRPATVRSGPANKADGKLTVFPGSEKGSIDFEACLSPHTLQALESDPDFARTLSS